MPYLNTPTGGATLPRLNFAIAAEALEPLIRVLALLPPMVRLLHHSTDGGARGMGGTGPGAGAGAGVAGGSHGGGNGGSWVLPLHAGGAVTHSSAHSRLPPAVQAALEALDQPDGDAARVWALQSADPHAESMLEQQLWGGEGGMPVQRSRL